MLYESLTYLLITTFNFCLTRQIFSYHSRSGQVLRNKPNPSSRPTNSCKARKSYGEDNK